jgi:predicted permease
MRFWRKLCFWFRGHRFEEELAEEMRLHRHLRAKRLMRDGLEPELAEREASRQFGNEWRYLEASNDVWVVRWLQDAVQDLRFMAHAMSKRPGFAMTAMATLGLGIGGATAVYSAVHAVLVAPLLYRDSHRVIVIWDRHQRDRESQTVASFADYEAYRKNAKLLDGVSAAGLLHPLLTYKGIRRQYLAGAVSPWTFELLGTKPLLGRVQFMEGSGCSLVLSYAFWTSALTADSAAIGQSLDFDGGPCTVQAVMPKGFRFYPQRADMWFFLDDPSGSKRFQYAVIVARLRPGVTLPQAKAELQAVHSALHANDDHGRDRAAEADDAQRELTYLASSTLQPTLIALFWAVASLLFIACLNVTGMLVARLLERRREFVVRAALGCGQGRLVRQALAEGMFLSMGGTVLGIVLAAVAVQMIGRKSLTEFPEGIAISVNTPVLCFAMLAGGIAVLVTALAPALFAVRAKTRFPSGIAGHRLGGTPRSRRASQIMIAGQIAACLLVLAGAALLVESVLHLETDALGFSTGNITAARLDLSQYHDLARRNAVHDDLIEKIQKLPGVSTAAIGTFFPPSRDAGTDVLEVRGNPIGKPIYDVASAAVSPGFFSLLRTPLVKGRNFDAHDPNGTPVAIVNESLTREYFATVDPLGQEIRVVGFSNTSPWMKIVGVAGDWKHLEWDAKWMASPMVFRPLAQDPTEDYAVAVRTQGNFAGLAREISGQIQSVNPSIPNEPLQTLDSRLEEMRAYPRFRAFIASFFALSALIIAAVGLHGTLTEFVSPGSRVWIAPGNWRADGEPAVAGRQTRRHSGG